MRSFLSGDSGLWPWGIGSRALALGSDGVKIHFALDALR